MQTTSDLTVAFYKAAKKRCFCFICGDPVIQLHHVRPDQKVAEVAKIARFGDMASLRAEFNKCVPLCDRDHRAVHLGKIKGWMLGQTVHGVDSHDHEARKWMPMLDVIGIDERILLPQHHHALSTKPDVIALPPRFGTAPDIRRQI